MKVVQTSVTPAAIGPYSQGIIVGKYEVLKVASIYLQYFQSSFLMEGHKPCFDLHKDLWDKQNLGNYQLNIESFASSGSSQEVSLTIQNLNHRMLMVIIRIQDGIFLQFRLIDT